MTYQRLHPMRARQRRAHWCTLAAALALIASTTAVSQDRARFPTPHDAKTIERVDAQPDRFIGAMFAFTGKLVQIEKLDNDKALLRILLADPNPAARHLWAAPLGTGGMDQLEVGDEVMVLGQLGRAKPEQLPPQGIDGYPAYHLLTLCVFNATRTAGIFLQAAEAKCLAWQDGAGLETLAPPE